MNHLPSGAFDRLGQISFVANTPPYLYRHFRNDPLVQHIGMTWPTQEILAQLSHYAELAKSKHETCVALHAFLVAISFKPLAEYQEFLAKFDPPARWVPELRGIIIANATTNRIMAGSSGMQPLEQVPLAAANTTTTRKLLVSGE